VIELNYTNINKAMNISVQSVFHGGERGKKNFTEGNRRLPIPLITEIPELPRPLFTSKKPRQQSHKAPGEKQGNHKISNRYGAAI
jgi:hypothetical protein